MKKTLVMLLALNSAMIYAASEATVICSPEAKQIEITQAVKWYRDSAEKKALYNQTYGIATIYVTNLEYFRSFIELSGLQSSILWSSCAAVAPANNRLLIKFFNKSKPTLSLLY